MCTDLLADTRDAARSLRRSPSFAVLLTLALGIGVGSAGAVFAMANQLLLRPLPGIADPRGAAFLEFNSPEHRTFLLSGPEVEALRGSATLLEGLATYRPFRHHVAVAGSRPIEVDGVTVYGDYFEVLGVRPLAGRLLAAGEAGPDVDPFVAVIGERLWDRMFGRSPDVVGRQLEEHRIFSRLLGMLSVLAVLVAAVGLYGVVAFAAAGRRREFAVRLALGADAHHIAKLVFGSAAAIVALGTALGLAGAYALSRVLESRLFAVAAMDLPSYAGAAGLLAAVAALACWLPARAAAAADPVSTLRRE